MKYLYILIDGNNLFWRSWCKNAKEVINGGSGAEYNGGILQFFQNIQGIRNKYAYKESEIYFLFDNTVSTLELRKVLSKGKYKSHRYNENKDINNFVYKDLEYLKGIIRCYDSNFRTVQKEKCEADDLVKPIIDTLQIDENKKCLLISADMDWSRSISDNIHWFNHKEVLNKQLFLEKYNFLPDNNGVVLYKSIRGDNSDCISPGIPNIPEKYVLEIVNNCDSLYDFFSNLDSLEIPDNWKEAVCKYQENIKMNYRLISFIDIEEDISNYIYYCKENVKKLQQLYAVKQLPLEERMKQQQFERKVNFLGGYE